MSTSSSVILARAAEAASSAMKAGRGEAERVRWRVDEDRREVSRI